MSQLYGGGQEPDDAQDRIDRIRRGGASQPPQPEPVPEPEPVQTPSRATGSSRRMSTTQPRSTERSRGGQAVLFIGAIVGIGVLVVLGLVLFNMFAGGGSGGQGPDSCNLAACHNCALVPETACEHFNRFLDRVTVVGDIHNPHIGYFKIR